MLFSGTVLDNIKYGVGDATMEQVKAAAQAANALVFIERLPEHFDTKLGEGGIQLSGAMASGLALIKNKGKKKKKSLPSPALRDTMRGTGKVYAPHLSLCRRTQRAASKCMTGMQHLSVYCTALIH